ncbi:T9SS type A sorting domain-containing protein [Arcicella sp. LKC2W]|uniref:T9SS type A sorting domain-containing protein n=1 Tax=Arcicella sp. LKC2W TaxID=2984198 RepID=UPI002B1FA406|nr:T9SS type A sorting domain-containing protein [Arcicella sp. LKC2W]MEA5458258.1 T9SS type A sorting domain-containing protein [Arcicella sp. LKC2W]
MIAVKKLLIISIFICLNHLVYSQIKLTSPLNRAVYQRNSIGFSAVTVAGSYQQQVDKIEARFIPVAEGQGQATDWETIKVMPLNGNFSVVRSVRQGWYRLEVRGSLNGQIIGGTTTVDRVGVGEVFIVAGQSNAEGVDVIQGIGAIDDRVNCFGTLNDRAVGGTSYVSLSPFSKLDSDTKIAPRGVNAWCWGRLGDLLARRLNVPIMFFNVAFGGTTSNAWATTANGGLAINPYVGGFYPNNLPYKNMSDVLKHFVPQLGVRAVLWCQGEADNRNANSNANITSPTTYKANLQSIINRSRAETDKNIWWVVSLTSLFSNCEGCVTSTDNNVIEGQLATIRETPNVIEGPYTDIIQPVGRQAGVHFTSGLSQLADAWNNSLTDNFFNTSTSSLPTVIPDLAFNCGDNRVEVALPERDSKGNAFNNYEWSNNGLLFDNGKFSSERKVILNVEGGRQYYARYRDIYGNVTQVPAISFAGSNVPNSTIIAEGATDFCEGNKAILKANNASNNAIIYEWSNGAKTQELTVTTSGSYSVKTISQFGCQSDFSSPLVITAKPGPPQPIISANTSTVFCADTNVVLTSSNQDAVSYLWSNGTTNRSLKVNTTGSFKVKSINSQGCISLESNELKVTVNPLPATPSIVPNGSTTFCADTSVVLTSSNQDAISYRWSTGSITRNITVKNAGDYSVKTIDKNGCVSNSSILTKIKVNALPPVPTISSTKDTVLCQGDNTILQMNLVSGGFPSWFAHQDGTTTRYNSQSLNVNKSGAFQAFQTDANGCKSAVSSQMYVSLKPLPAKITTVTRISPYTIGFTNTQATTYIWQFNGTTRTDVNGNVIRATEAGKYNVTAKNVYKTLFYGDKVCLAPVSDDFLFELYNDNGMSIYPNPTKGEINIDSKIDWRNSTIEIYNLSGAFIKKGFVSIFDDVKKLDLSDLPEGEYMLRIKSDNFYTITKRIIINR